MVSEKVTRVTTDPRIREAIEVLRAAGRADLAEVVAALATKS